jgi:hypothetical protein
MRHLLLILVIGLTQSAWAAPMDSALSACGSVKDALGPETRCPNEYRCEVDDSDDSDDRKYFVVRIKSRCPAPPDAGPDWVGSSLVGTYGVRKRDGVVVEWNEADRVAGRPLTVETTPRTLPSPQRR